MDIGTTLNLKDYRIIKVLLSERNPFDCVEEIGLELREIEERMGKIYTLIGNYLNLP